ncbi:MarR family winged helix-turn-helix transcriptional regulator [Falsihalocynthiibacter sp. BN13B15]|uniref:MarR family winged helix-turn-helix transcriptional regulator n=1 Tax=Falsihalocynthiibacter sp. BN13B15 TaxID=3240871 RepID=UPI003510B190
MSFSINEFLPYLLNQTSEAVSKDFQPQYRERYGMLRTEWRVLFHLGIHGKLTAKEICTLASLHKTKVSRAVTALEAKRFLSRTADENDRRLEHLSLTKQGQKAYADLHKAAQTYEEKITSALSEHEIDTLKSVLKKLG